MLLKRTTEGRSPMRVNLISLSRYATTNASRRVPEMQDL